MKRTAKGTVFALLLLCAVSWCTADDLLGLTLKPEVPIAVPDLVGRSEERAAEYDWIAAVSSYRYDSAPAGTVLAQNPVAGSLRKPSGRGTVTVRLTVSLGPARAEIPDLSGADAHEAAATLRGLGLAVEEVRLPGGDAGRVARTEPAAGRDNAKTVAVPDLRGMTRGAALLTLFRAGLSVSEDASSAGIGSVVLSQSPAAGSIVTAGCRVTLVFGANSPDE